MAYTRWTIRRIHRRDRKPVILYFHPWELDPDQPRISGSWKSRFRHYFNLSKTSTRLTELLSQHRFEPMINLLNRLDGGKVEERPVREPLPAVSM